MKLRSLVLALAVAAALVSAGSAQAGGILVNTDSGTIGGVDITNAGISGGVTTLEITRVPNLFSFVNTVNGATLTPPEPVTVEGPITLLVTPTTPEHYSLALSPATYTKTVGSTVGSQAIMSFDMHTGVAPTVLPNFFNMSGNIVSLLANADPVLDFARFAAGGTINFTFTGTTFAGGADSFASLITTPGSSVVANGSFSQASVPEPASIAMMGIGLTGILAFKRLFRKARA
jgi:PEP-CTERM motif